VPYPGIPPIPCPGPQPCSFFYKKILTIIEIGGFVCFEVGTDKSKKNCI
jgi:hypothetical protein